MHVYVCRLARGAHWRDGQVCHTVVSNWIRFVFDRAYVQVFLYSLFLLVLFVNIDRFTVFLFVSFVTHLHPDNVSTFTFMLKWDQLEAKKRRFIVFQCEKTRSMSTVAIISSLSLGETCRPTEWRARQGRRNVRIQMHASVSMFVPSFSMWELTGRCSLIIRCHSIPDSACLIIIGVQMNKWSLLFVCFPSIKSQRNTLSSGERIAFIALVEQQLFFAERVRCRHAQRWNDGLSLCAFVVFNL